MADTIQFKRGLQANLPASGLAGEPIFCTDTGLLVMGTGSGINPANGVVSDLLANRPTAGIEGRWFFATDAQQLYRDNGAAWVGVALGTPSPVRLQNIEIMLAWDLYSDDPRMDDLIVEDFADSDFIDPSSHGSYDSVNDCYKRVAATTGNSALLTFDGESKVDIPDLKGSITNWVQDSGDTGHFTDGSTALSLGAGNDCPDVVIGLEVVFGDASTTSIAAISGDGSGTGAVTLSATKASATVSKIRGAQISGGALTLTDTGSGSPATIGSDGDPNSPMDTLYIAYVTYLSNHQVPNGVTITDVWWNGYHQHASYRNGNVKFKIAKDNGDGTYDVIDISQTEAFTGASSYAFRQAFSLDTPYQVPATGTYYLAVGFSEPFARRGWEDTEYFHHIVSTSDGGAWTKRQQSDASGNNIGSWDAMGNWRMEIGATYIGSPEPTAKTIVVTNSDANAWNSSGWNHIESAAIVQSLAGSSATYWAYSWDDKATFWAWTGSVWRQIVRENGGTWEYQNNSEVWTAAHVNSPAAALEDAFGETDNQCGEATVEAISQANWETTNGFNPGSTVEINVAFALVADGSGNAPSITSHEFTFSTPAEDMVLILDPWEASAADPDNAYVVAKIKDNGAAVIGTDLKAFISIDDGANYEEISGLATFQSIGDYDFIRGELTSITPRSDQTIRGKIETYNDVDVEIHSVSVGVSYA